MTRTSKRAEEQQYLRSLARAESVHIDDIPATELPPHPALRHLRLRLTRFAYKAGAIFGTIMSEMASAVTDVQQLHT